MPIEDWIDEVAALAGEVLAHAGSGKDRVRSFWVFKKEEYPETITEYPSAITYVQGMRFDGGGDGGPHIMHWRGVTEFHICESTAKQGIPMVLPYFGKILAAFVSKRTLGGKVVEFNLIKSADGEAITAGKLDYGAGSPPVLHLGLVAYWHVKEKVDLVVGR